MGVTGSGKTTVGRRIAEKLGSLFFDGDDFHPARNIAKMQSGHPLNDEDRAPWLDRLRELLSEHLAANGDVVLACSALREVYRQRLLPEDPLLAARVSFVCLKISREVAHRRLRERAGHFMPEALVDSQFDALEAPAGAICVDAEASVGEVVNRVLSGIRDSRMNC
jgi:gluconokinase